ncbi:MULTISPECIES: NAD-dependent succinate-semialdehyde dehydrogenase [Gammaproteobacteria]|uniref:NAD-dependent succinate-semialdehyde dehydrogenase n=1 Tax=Gammaproteobacteria TaxID=1236 RepID=UPI000DD0E635|nr:MULTISPECIES: NAD-dependent succinate-semialdehyde dehydrogenase [Gammaproteobacteria]RTE86624.1 NAD-dependent succinate-semialdehyde dehydrogenase [Aliidiomarina sp. B3213]TCZ90821.1 NAD-dependent succinate-semialdehyde dehydrogenase [Lysobacter sp. N42]
MTWSNEAKQLFKQQCLVNGQWISSSSSETISVNNPASNETLGTVPSLSSAESEKAIHAAHQAFPAWRKKTANERSSILRNWFNLIMDHQDALAEIMTREQGKPLAEASGEIAYAASFIEWYAEEGKRVYGETIPGASEDARIVVTREPVGVCAAITPWNFPAAMITRKVGPALAAGCTMVVKPASQTPFTALAIAELAIQAGVPDGVLNVITGSAKEIGEQLSTHPLVRKISFTGSTAVGSTLMAQASSTIKNISLELGGNAPFIVFDDADIEAAAEGAVACKFRNAGQTCVCTNRIYVQRSVYPEFLAAFREKVAALKVGDGLESDVVIGPLINNDAVKKVEEHIEDALSQGGSLELGGKPHELGGLWFQPTIVGNATQSMKCAHEETFGPLAPLFIFDDESEAIEHANDTEFGLAAYFYAQNIHRIRRVSEALEAGIIGVNTGLISNAAAPFGGVKSSGLGREGGRHGIEEYTEMKYLCLGGEA